MNPRGAVILGLKDPPGLRKAPRAPAIFDPRPERNQSPGIPWIPHELKHVPDQLLIATQVAIGMPRQAAEQVRYHGGARGLALKLWCDVQDAAAGDTAAKQRVDYYRESFTQLRRQEAIADDPRRIGNPAI